jgi:hypothetical protein
MREIKFRAWVFYDDRGTRKMIDVGAMRIFGDIAYVYDENGDEFQINTPDLSQFTGLKDKNGKEIYEGDIIYSESWWWGPCAVEYRSGKTGPCVGENVMEWGLSKCHNLWDGKEVKVIGNIYESPELLEGK